MINKQNWKCELLEQLIFYHWSSAILTKQSAIKTMCVDVVAVHKRDIKISGKLNSRHKVQSSTSSSSSMKVASPQSPDFTFSQIRKGILHSNACAFHRVTYTHGPSLQPTVSNVLNLNQISITTLP